MSDKELKEYIDERIKKLERELRRSTIAIGLTIVVWAVVILLWLYLYVVGIACVGI